MTEVAKVIIRNIFKESSPKKKIQEKILEVRTNYNVFFFFIFINSENKLF